MPNNRVWTARDKAMVFADGDLVGEVLSERAVAGQPEETAAHRYRAANKEARGDTDVLSCAAGRDTAVQYGQRVGRDWAREARGEDGEDLAQYDGTHCDLSMDVQSFRNSPSGLTLTFDTLRTHGGRSTRTHPVTVEPLSDALRGTKEFGEEYAMWCAIKSTPSMGILRSDMVGDSCC